MPEFYIALTVAATDGQVIILSNDEVGIARTFSIVVSESGRVLFRGEAKTVEPRTETAPPRFAGGGGRDLNCLHPP